MVVVVAGAPALAVDLGEPLRVTVAQFRRHEDVEKIVVEAVAAAADVVPLPSATVEAVGVALAVDRVKQLPDDSPTTLLSRPAAHEKILRTAHTIADLDQGESIQPVHLNEAVNYRMLDRSLWT